MDRTLPARADYGLDAPFVMRNLALAGAASLAAGLLLSALLRASLPILATLLLIWGLAASASLLTTALLMLWSSKIGKLRERERLIDSLALRGDETVLDLGCGRGLLLNAAARRLDTGKAIGIDLWQAQDQSGNHPETTLSNARAEGVGERVEVQSGDMRELPFPDGTMDVVVSSLAIHNVPTRAGREKAVREIDRVLKPGGRAALLDFQCTEEYAQTLRAAGWSEVTLSAPHYGMFPPVRIVSGTKPAPTRP